MQQKSTLNSMNQPNIPVLQTKKYQSQLILGDRYKNISLIVFALVLFFFNCSTTKLQVFGFFFC